MGRFCTSIHIHNHLSREKFIELFCETMQKNGYSVSNSEDYNTSYAMLFSKNLKWVSVIADSEYIAKLMNMDCIRVEIVDSDFATLDMYSGTGEKVESILIGAPYWDDDENAQMGYSQPTESAWSSLIEDGFTWEHFTEIYESEDIFVEDTLQKLARLLGMGYVNILFEKEDINENNENICCLYFKK
ncbi:MAG: hypothetical protein K2I80_05915 [Ruminococcus sp.]|nr:hypothetical protein [Ruminococcus sp.]